MAIPGDSLTDKLSIETPIFTISSHVVLGAILALLFAVFLSITVCFLRRKRRRARRRSSLIPVASEEIAQYKDPDRKIQDIQIQPATELKTRPDLTSPGRDPSRDIELPLPLGSTSGSPGPARDIGWGRWYALRELEEATGGFAEVNVIGEGGYGVVYRGVLPDGSLVAVKNLMNNNTGMLNEASDVYSFGVLLMEIITGRIPVDYSKPPGEMNLIDWFKSKVAVRQGEEVVDPLIVVQPTPRQLKRVLLVCLRCIDADVAKRPKMGQVVHMLEAEEFPFRASTIQAQR
uniref:non-specific serine/threonine protein kinase n=1 Tax=Kalanchoe fedtschenkoi TaxID=63787 RepID=A0A7N0T3P6_KALFE